jgi:hypothetical protein
MRCALAALKAAMGCVEAWEAARQTRYRARKWRVPRERNLGKGRDGMEREVETVMV